MRNSEFFAGSPDSIPQDRDGGPTKAKMDMVAFLVEQSRWIT